MSTEVKPDVDLEEMLANEIPCQGTAGRGCHRPAVLRSDGHHCPAYPGPHFKCIPCWQKWYTDVINMIEKTYFICHGCRRRFWTIEEFSDYRPF